MTPHVLWVIVHSLAVVVFVNRYIAGIILRVIRGNSWDESRDDYEPTVTAVIPMFNEGAAIKETLRSLLDSEYPHAKLAVATSMRARLRESRAGDSGSFATGSMSGSGARSSAQRARLTPRS
jgi:cellulose synthase/poly-beta-1,6-N-acetylglucosamine synthase-like glycosyltransferase